MKILFLTFLICFSLDGVAVAQVVVIAHPSVKKDTITRAELLDLYSRDIRLWDDGKPVVVFDLKPKNEVKETFYKYLGKSISRMKSIWMKKMLSGEGDPPEALDTEDVVLKKVMSTPGAIGFVDQAKVTDAVKVLMVIEPKKEQK